MKSRDVIWQPQPKQAVFMSRFEDEALYGGAAGGGKSDALVMEALRQVEIPYYRGLIVRRTFPQLEDLIGKTLRLYPSIYPRAKYNDSKHVWKFPSGAVVIFGSIPHLKDKYNYQGKPYDFIGFDELTQFPYELYDYLVHSRNRPNGPGTRVYSRATANPGGVGHGWVKEMFITAAPPMQTVWKKIKVKTPEGERMRWKSSVFVNADVFDNKALLENDPDYIYRLASMPEAQRNALLYGDWDSFSGQVFTEWRNDREHYADRRNTHVIDPFRIPPGWKVWRSMDWGYTRPFSVAWYAVDYDRRLYRIRELYGCTGTPNEGVKWYPDKVAEEILRIEREDPNLQGRTITGVADPAIFADSGSESVAAAMERKGVFWEPGNHDRLNGKMQLHNRLAFDEHGYPMLYVFSTNKNFIRTVPNLVYSETDVEDVDTEQEDHIYDECRYLCMEFPVSRRIDRAAKISDYNPLESEHRENREYAWYRKY